MPVVKKPQFCSKCRKQYFSVKWLQKHIMRTHNTHKVHPSPKCTRNFVCAICPKAFSSVKFKNRHELIHREEKRFKCSFCEKSFAVKRLKSKHEKTHYAEKFLQPVVLLETIQCNEKSSQNGQTCLSKEGTNTHETNTKCSSFKRGKVTFKDCHKRGHLRGKSYLCGLCGTSFKDYNVLEIHVRTHTKEKPYKCPICAAAFISLENLQRHQAHHIKPRHHNDENYECEYCGKIFKTASRKESHTQLHSFPTSYRCVFCEKRFRKKENRQKHLKTHNSERPYTCSLCGKSFKSKELKQSHEQVHTRLYQCAICDESFQYRVSKKIHEKRRHFETSSPTCNLRRMRKSFKKRYFPCTTCGKNLFTLREWKEHKKTHKTLLRSKVVFVKFA